MVEEFVACFMTIAEGTEHGTGSHAGMFFFDTAHHGAHMGTFDDDADAEGIEDIIEGIGDLGGHPFLDLEAAGKDFDDAGNFREADHFFVGDVGDAGTAKEGEHMVFT